MNDPNRFRLLQEVALGGRIVSLHLVPGNDVEVLVRWPSGSETLFLGSELFWDEVAEHWFHRVRK